MELVQPAYSGLQIRVRSFMENPNLSAARGFSMAISHTDLTGFTSFMLYTFYSFAITEYPRPSPSDSSPSLKKPSGYLGTKQRVNLKLGSLLHSI